MRNISIKKLHKLKDIFLKIDLNDQKEIYKIWLKIDGNNMPECKESFKIFEKNLEIISNYFVELRYEHESSSSSVSGIGFLLQFTNSLKIFLKNNTSTY